MEEVKNSPTKVNYRKSNTITSELIDDHRATDKLFFLIQRSAKEDLVEIERLIENDPRRFARSSTDPESFVNKPNLHGIRPLYEACKHGYAHTAQLLLDHGANPHLISSLDEKDHESALQVSCRWSYIQVTEYLLNNTSWTRKEIKEAMARTRNSAIIELLKSRLLPTKRFCLCSS